MESKMEADADGRLRLTYLVSFFVLKKNHMYLTANQEMNNFSKILGSSLL